SGESADVPYSAGRGALHRRGDAAPGRAGLFLCESGADVSQSAVGPPHTSGFGAGWPMSSAPDAAGFVARCRVTFTRGKSSSFNTSLQTQYTLPPATFARGNSSSFNTSLQTQYTPPPATFTRGKSPGLVPKPSVCLQGKPWQT